MSPNIFTVRGVRNPLALTSDRLPKDSGGAEALFSLVHQKDEEHRASLRGSELYLLSATRERERGRMGGVKKEKGKKHRNEKERETEEGLLW